VVVGAFSLMGAIVAITGFMQTSYSGASTTTVGDLMELDAIAACVIGGASLRGGRGTVMGSFSGPDHGEFAQWHDAARGFARV